MAYFRCGNGGSGQKVAIGSLTIEAGTTETITLDFVPKFFYIYKDYSILSAGSRWQGAIYDYNENANKYVSLLGGGTSIGDSLKDFDSITTYGIGITSINNTSVTVKTNYLAITGTYKYIAIG